MDFEETRRKLHGYCLKPHVRPEIVAMLEEAYKLGFSDAQKGFTDIVFGNFYLKELNNAHFGLSAKQRKG